MKDSTTTSGGTRLEAATIPQINILWLTGRTGMRWRHYRHDRSNQPSIEDLVRGAYPWIPKAHFYNLFLEYENGDDFEKHFRDAADGRIDPQREE
jgi:hypothetical protein